MKFSFLVRSLFTLAVVLLLIGSCGAPGENDPFPRLTGDYLGQTPPGAVAEVFAPGLVSTGMADRDLAMTPDGDEIYWTVNTPGFRFSAIVVTRREGGVWTKPEVASFCRNPEWSAGEPAISTDGEHFYFISNRPVFEGDDSENDDIWVMDRVAGGWGEPYNLGAPINTDAPEFYPSLTRDGTMYFCRADPRTRVHLIYRSRLVDGAYQEAELLPEAVNAGRSQFNAFVDPDEKWIIVPTVGLAESLGGVDQFISFRNDDDTWRGPFNLGDQVNSPAMREWSASLTPDGRYLFFMSNRQPDVDETAPIDYGAMLAARGAPRNGNSDVYWIDAAIIEELRATTLAEAETREDDHE